MASENIYLKLAGHLSRLGMGYPDTEDLQEILKENFTSKEAEVALALPTRVIPLHTATVEEIQRKIDMPSDELEQILNGLSERGLLFNSIGDNGEKGFALQQVGFSFPQTFFWKGEDNVHARKMAGMVAKYFNRKVTEEAYSNKTNPYRYIPISGTVEIGAQSVYPHHSMENVIEKATDFALCHCSCRMISALRGRPCGHPLEVCIKFDEIARYVTDNGLGKKINRSEARDIIIKTEEAGLVHFVDNTGDKIKHNCNCCGCACWNVGSIRRRKIPRDVLMATYFIRVTDLSLCSGCGECMSSCPVDALNQEDDLPVVDERWCIGCGVCVTRCETGAAKLILRRDRNGELPASDFKELHQTILKEKSLKN